MKGIKVWLTSGDTFKCLAMKVVTENGTMRFELADGTTVAEFCNASDVLAWSTIRDNGQPALKRVKERRHEPVFSKVAKGRATPRQRQYLRILMEKNPDIAKQCGVNINDPNLTQGEANRAIDRLK